MDIFSLMEDPDFRNLHPEEKRKAFAEVDPTFGKLPLGEQRRGVFELSNQTAGMPKRTAEATPEPVTNAPNHEALRQKFVTDQGTLATRIKDYATTPNTEYASGVGDYLSRIVPKSAANLVSSLATLPKGLYDKMNAPETVPMSDSEALGALVSGTGGTLADLGKMVAAPVGLMGGEKFKEAWGLHPVESAAVLAPVVAPLAKPLARTARGAGEFAVSPVAKTAQGVADLIGEKPESMMSQALKQSTTLDEAQRAKNVKTALEGGYLPNKTGVERLKNDIMSINRQIGDTISAGRNSGMTVDIENIIAPIEDLRAKAIDSGADWGNNLKTLDGIVDSIRTNPKVMGGKVQGGMNYGGQIPVDVAQRWKVDVYKQLNDNVWGEFTSYAKEGRKALARGAKEAIADLLPEVSDLNAKDSSLYGLQDVLERAANRIGNREGVGIGPAIKIGAGAAAGKPGMIAGAVLAVIEHPSIQPRLALALYKARKGAISMAESRSIIKQRVQEMADKLTGEQQ